MMILAYASRRVFCEFSRSCLRARREGRGLRIATGDSGVVGEEAVDLPLHEGDTYFRNIPKNIRSFDVSSGSFSGAALEGPEDASSEVDEGAVEAGESSNEPEDAEAMAKGSSYKINGVRDRGMTERALDFAIWRLYEFAKDDSAVQPRPVTKERERAARGPDTPLITNLAESFDAGQPRREERSKRNSTGFDVCLSCDHWETISRQRGGLILGRRRSLTKCIWVIS